MKKMLLILSLLFFSSASAYAFGIGARAMAMGGAYTALANDITSAYWNPAGLVHGDIRIFDAMAGQGIDANFGLDRVADFINPPKLISDYTGRDAEFSGSINGIAGLSLYKIGLSYIPWANISFSKNATETEVHYEGVAKRSLALTFGGTFNTNYPFLSRVSVGANIRYVYGQLYRIDCSGTPVKVTYATAQGVGLDLGAQADVAPFTKAGLTLRNLLTGMQWSGKTDLYTSFIGGKLTIPYATEDFEESDKTPASVVFGIASDIPAIALFSADVNYTSPYSDIHLGVEKRFFAGIFALRAGYYTEAVNSTSKLTYGCGLDLGIINADLAFGQDALRSEDKIVSASVSSVF